MDTLHLRRKDTTRGPPLRVLSLDGGGVRGYSMLILLQELMHRTYVECEGKAPSRNQIPKPCDHFDLIAGTGTGGLIALMLGRLRLDLETCKDVYVRMTRRVFETDKTIAGIPYRSTLFKASKLEEAIRQCVWEHTVAADEGNDGSPMPAKPVSLHGPVPRPQSSHTLQRRTSRSSVNTIGASPVRSPVSSRGSMGIHGPSWGNADAILYDKRENRTKTAVVAVYKGTPMNGTPTLLRSYDSRKEPPPEFNCTIWQAGRATCATGLAFKPILVGQHVFIDEGAGKYNPAPMILDEAAVNEWPGREVGLFVSVGTGKRPPGTSHIQHEWWEDVFAESLGNFAEARRRLIAKIEGCEKTHQYMLKEHLRKRNVPLENYVRLNVEVGVGEFGMNEWNRLAEISTSTRNYLSRSDVQKMNQNVAAKLAKIHFIHRRLAAGNGGMDWPADSNSFEEGLEDGDVFQRQYHRPVPPIPMSLSSPQTIPPRSSQPSAIEFPDAVELPGEDFIPFSSANNTFNSNPPRFPTSSYSQIPSAISPENYTVLTSDDHPQPLNFSRKTSIPIPAPSSPTHNQSSPFTSQTRLNNNDKQNQQSINSRPQSSYNNPPSSSPRISSEMFTNPLPQALTTRPQSSHQNLNHNHVSVLHSHTPPLSPPPSHPPPPPPLPPKTPIPYPENGYGLSPPSGADPGTGSGSHGYAPAVMPIPPRAPNRPNSNYYESLQSGVGVGNGHGGGIGNGAWKLPYPSDGPPPLVNKARKPTYTRR
ncbi:patatin-like serine hydrolase [Histoplasma ohiense]|nr:patatin-like serine hydrolase [Histoplasma ohiense (nom. inval.)]